MKTIIRKKVITMKAHSLETLCARCGKCFRRELYFLIRRYHRSGKISSRKICNRCIKTDEKLTAISGQ